MALTDNGKIKISTNSTNGTDGTWYEYSVKTCNVRINSLAKEDSGRVESGVMYISYLYNRIRSIQIELPPCTQTQSAAVLGKVVGKQYYITYFDPIAGEKTSKCYTSAGGSSLKSGVIKGGLFEGVSFNAIELAGENV